MPFSAPTPQSPDAIVTRVVFYGAECDDTGLPVTYHVYYLVTDKSPDLAALCQAREIESPNISTMTAVMSFTAGTLEPRERFFYGPPGNFEASLSKAIAALRTLPCNLGLTCNIAK